MNRKTKAINIVYHSTNLNQAARFTGKAYDSDLGAYVFPFRNYDPRIARWTSQDPAGFPDGINQHFYAAVPTIGLDPLGTDVWHYNATNGAMGFGHSAWISGNSSSGYNVYDYGNEGGKSGSVSGDGTNINGQHFDNFNDAQNALMNNRNANNPDAPFDRSQTMATDSAQDAAFNQAADNYMNQPYDLNDHNCYQLGVEACDAADVVIHDGWRPNDSFDQNEAGYWQRFEM